MTAMSRTERAALCDLALQLGPDAPTLCGDWTVRELVAHLLVREGNPVALGLVVPPLARVTEAATQRVAARDFAMLVERLRGGPPFYSWFRLPKVERLANTGEFFIHHEDVRRAQPDWRPRQLADREQSVLWRATRASSRVLLRPVAVGVTLERADTGERAEVKPGERQVVVRGLPAELCLFVFGRQQQAQVELDGSAVDVAALTGASLGF